MIASGNHTIILWPAGRGWRGPASKTDWFIERTRVNRRNSIYLGKEILRTWSPPPPPTAVGTPSMQEGEGIFPRRLAGTIHPGGCPARGFPLVTTPVCATLRTDRSIRGIATPVLRHWFAMTWHRYGPPQSLRRQLPPRGAEFYKFPFAETFIEL